MMDSVFIENEEITALGIMSGTSLDGLDLALCKFVKESNKWNFSIISAITYEYKESWKEKLTQAPHLNGFNLIELHRNYGFYIGKKINLFLKQQNLKPDLIASHGHTVFHEPENRFNFQLGDGAAIAAETGITTVSDFRSLDICLGGQGAPLVPIGDHHLFSEYGYCINFGGIANISMLNRNNERIAYDICPVNFILNWLSGYLGGSFDKDGEWGRSGKINPQLLNQLNNLGFYSLNPPKSIGREWIEKNVIEIINKSRISVYDKMRTFYEHIAMQVADNIKDGKNNKAIITGGGALNKFLIELLQDKSDKEIIIPNRQLIDYKEALIFAFLGVLRMSNTSNCLKSVTGAIQDNCGGQVFFVNS
ncbi:MAG: anhydro-N-acetylmuramic acid kinase [Bacteroidales bacterium]